MSNISITWVDPPVVEKPVTEVRDLKQGDCFVIKHEVEHR